MFLFVILKLMVECSSFCAEKFFNYTNNCWIVNNANYM
jgi:hypothetical protein